MFFTHKNDFFQLCQTHLVHMYVYLHLCVHSVHCLICLGYCQINENCVCRVFCSELGATGWKGVCVFVELVATATSRQGVDLAEPLPDPLVHLPLLSTHKSCQDTLATARVIAQTGQRWDEGENKGGTLVEGGRCRETAKIGGGGAGVGSTMVVSKMQRRCGPIAGRGLSLQELCLDELVSYDSSFVWGVASICPSWGQLGESWLDGKRVMTMQEDEQG